MTAYKEDKCLNPKLCLSYLENLMTNGYNAEFSKIFNSFAKNLHEFAIKHADSDYTTRYQRLLNYQMDLNNRVKVK